MKFTHTVETPYRPTFRTEKVAGMFDVPIQEKLVKSWEVDMPIEEGNWNVGLICGPSGCGKTTLAKRVFGDEAYHRGFAWTPDKSLLDDFSSDLSVKEITDALSHVGFSSPPAWMVPFRNLSNGQQFRAEMARLILERTDGTIVVDEFTSVVDRTVAKISSAAVQKYVRKMGRKFVAVSCHDDIKEWLQPDWIYQVDTGTFTRGSLRRPPIEIKLFRCHHAAWRIFKGHHYLSADLNKAAHCFIATVEGRPVAFAAALPFPHPHVKNMWKGHRTVVLPDFQGIGVGNVVSETVADYFLAMGKRYTSVTSHPAMIAHRMKSKRWILTRAPEQVAKAGKNGALTTSTGRMTASFEYIGDGSRHKVLETKKREPRVKKIKKAEA